MTHLSLVQVSGVSYYELYENFFEEADTEKTGVIPALRAAKYLKRSGLSDSLLSKIWDQADLEKKGELHKQGFFIALKLIALAQQGTDPALANLISDIPPPRLSHPSGGSVDHGAPTPPTVASPPQPLDSNTGALVLSATASAARIATPPADVAVWEVNSEDRAKYDKLFFSLSPDGTKLSGEQVRPLFLQSGLPTDVLVTIWDLSDIDKDGALDHEEFVLAMHLTQRRLTGKPLPDRVPASIVARLKGHPAQPVTNTAGATQMGFENHFSGFTDFTNLGGSNDLGGITCESEGLMKEIEEIKKQKLDVDLQVLQLESDLKLKQAEMKVMQRELDHMSSTYLQLEVQKEEAQKRLDELADTAAKLRMSHDEYDEKIRREEETIKELQGQMNSQEMSARSHEEEIAHLRSELNDLMVEESLLQEQLASSNRQVAALQRENQQSEEEQRRSEAKTQLMLSHKTQLEEVLASLTALIRGEALDRALPPDELINNLLDGRPPVSSDLDGATARLTASAAASTAPSSRPESQSLPARPPSVPAAWASESGGAHSGGKASGLISAGGHQFRPASASPQAVPFTAHFPSSGANPSVVQGGANAAAWPPVGSGFGGQAPGKTSSIPPSRHALTASFGAGSNTMPPAPTEAPVKTKSKKSKSPFSRNKKSSSSREHGSHHQKTPPVQEQSGFGDFADFSRFDGQSRAKACPSEDEQLAWAKMESQRMQRDEEKKRRQEEADLQLAIQLSKMSS